MKRPICCLFVLIVASSALAGARIDLRPSPPIPSEGYQPNTVIDVDVVIVDTGNPQGNIVLRGLSLDFADSSALLTYPGLDSIVGTDDDDRFVWNNPLGLASVWPDLPYTWYCWCIGPNPPFQLTLPDDGELWLGHISIHVGETGGTLDVLNADEPSEQRGASVHFGLGQPPDDPVTTWRAYTGDLTGGMLDLPVVPEPALGLLSCIGASCILFRRKWQ